jgi:hypothetical protein
MVDLTDPMDWLARQLDPSILMHDLGLSPDAWQEQVLRSRSKRMLLVVGRQLGKILVAAIRGLHRACFVPGTEVLIISVGERQAQLLFDRMKDCHERLGLVPTEKELRTELWLANKSRVIALPGSPATTRGYSPSLVILDEASRIDNGSLAAVAPMISETDGDLMALTTPAGRRGFLYDAWIDESQEWERVSAKRIDYPNRMRPGFLEEQLKILGPALFSQEHENAWIEDSDQLISDSAIQAMSRYDNRPNTVIMTAMEGL